APPSAPKPSGASRTSRLQASTRGCTGGSPGMDIEMATMKQCVGKWLFARLPITRFLFDQLRFEANAWIVACQNSLWPSRRRRLRELRAKRHLLVNVACGPQILDDFVNLELLGPPPRVRWDCRRGVPLADASAAGIRVEHFLEHIEPREELPAFLR